MKLLLILLFLAGCATTRPSLDYTAYHTAERLGLTDVVLVETRDPTCPRPARSYFYEALRGHERVVGMMCCRHSRNGWHCHASNQ